jgi:hypothetical protein
MSTPGKCCNSTAPAMPFSDESVQALLAALAPYRNKTLAFEFEGRPIQPGYHVTEVKTAEFRGLDCGANREAWPETFIQLWDIPEETGKPPMTVAKFLAIMEKFGSSIPFAPDGKLTFEVSDPGSAMRLYAYAGIESSSDRVLVSLEPRPASCKPRDRWLEDAPERVPAACC